MGGISSLALAASLFIFDLRKLNIDLNLQKPLVKFNSCLFFSSILTVIFYSSNCGVLHLIKSSLNFVGNIGLPLKLGSLIYAIMYVVVLWILVIIYTKRKFL